MTIATGVLVSPGIARIARRNWRPLVSGIRRSRMMAWAVGLGQRQPFVGRQRRPHLVAFQAKHSRKRVGDADVVVDDQDTSDAVVIAARGHGPLWGPARSRVNGKRGDSPNRVLSFHAGLPTTASEYVHPGGALSPILVRPVREQLEHDRVIRLLQAKYKRKFDVAINPGHEQTMPVGGRASPWYPGPRAAVDRARTEAPGVVEVETAESVNNLEAMSQWAAFSRLRAPFHLYVPSSTSTRARLCTDLQIPVAEIWAYNALGDQMRFTLVQRSGGSAERQGRRAAAAPAAPPGRRGAQSSGNRRPRPCSARHPRSRGSPRKAAAPRPRRAPGASWQEDARSRAQKRK